jgi:hypothetical protein
MLENMPNLLEKRFKNWIDSCRSHQLFKRMGVTDVGRLRVGREIRISVMLALLVLCFLLCNALVSQSVAS